MDWKTHARIAIVAFGLAICVGSAGATVVINEIMANPRGDENAREYIELLNTGDTQVKLTGWHIGNTSGDDMIIAPPGSFLPVTIPPGGCLLIFDPDYFDGDEPYVNIPSGAGICTIESSGFGRYGIINSRIDTLTLRSPVGVVDRIQYTAEDVEEGLSLERIDPMADGMDLANWAPSHLYDGSPGAPNYASQSAPASGTLRIGPDVPEMSATFEIEWPEAPVIASVRIYDALGRNVRDLVTGQRQTARVTLIWDGRDDRGNVLQTGRYVVLAEAVSVDTGRRLRLRGTVVLARRR